MKNLTLLLGATALLAACRQQPAAAPPPVAVAPAPAPASAPAPVVLAPEAIGAVKFGARLTEVEAALKEKAQGTPSGECTYVRFASIPQVLFMVENGVVMRADIKGDVPNVSGIGIGGDPAAVKAKFPAAVVGPHKYVEKGHTTTIAGGGKAALIFEDDGSRITGVRAGLEPAVSYSEGCS